tara:strand:+ start:205 stop:540 length:336 start_codon:yes stop_codon:yes gene_type:complete
MKSEKLYLRKKLNIEEVAINIGISVKKIRATIFINTGKTFNDFINDYRIERAKKLIENGFLDIYTTSALGENCGFNSHQTFLEHLEKHMVPLLGGIVGRKPFKNGNPLFIQ